MTDKPMTFAYAIHQRIYERSYDSWIISKHIRSLRIGHCNPTYLLAELAAMRRHLHIIIKAQNKGR
jgi:hypothetical protein